MIGIIETCFLTKLMRKKSFLRIGIYRTILGQVVKKGLLKWGP